MGSKMEDEWLETAKSYARLDENCTIFSIIAHFVTIAVAIKSYRDSEAYPRDGEIVGLVVSLILRLILVVAAHRLTRGLEKALEEPVYALKRCRRWKIINVASLTVNIGAMYSFYEYHADATFPMKLTALVVCICYIGLNTSLVYVFESTARKLEDICKDKTTSAIPETKVS